MCFPSVRETWVYETFISAYIFNASGPAEDNLDGGDMFCKAFSSMPFATIFGAFHEAPEAYFLVQPVKNVKFGLDKRVF